MGLHSIVMSGNLQRPIGEFVALAAIIGQVFNRQ